MVPSPVLGKAALRRPQQPPPDPAAWGVGPSRGYGGDVQRAGLPLAPEGPPFGFLHRFHNETSRTGTLSEDGRRFTKEEFKGRLSVVTESEVRRGVLRYAVQFTAGE